MIRQEPRNVKKYFKEFLFSIVIFRETKIYYDLFSFIKYRIFLRLKEKFKLLGFYLKYPFARGCGVQKPMTHRARFEDNAAHTPLPRFILIERTRFSELLKRAWKGGDIHHFRKARIQLFRNIFSWRFIFIFNNLKHLNQRDFWKIKSISDID